MFLHFKDILLCYPSNNRSYYLCSTICQKLKNKIECSKCKKHYFPENYGQIGKKSQNCIFEKKKEEENSCK